MELGDRLLSILIGAERSTATRQLMAAGYTEDEVRGAWNFARSAATPSRPGPAGKARAAEIRRAIGER